MNQLIPLVCLVVVLVGYRLYFGDTLRKRPLWFAGEIQAVFSVTHAQIDALAQAMLGIGKATTVASAQMAKLGATMRTINLDGWQYSRGTGEVRE